MDGDAIVGHATIAAAPRSDDVAAVHTLAAMKSQEIRETFLSFFEERGHLRLPSASLVPVRARPLGAADRPPGCSRSSPTSWGARSRRRRG